MQPIPFRHMPQPTRPKVAAPPAEISSKTRRFSSSTRRYYHLRARTAPTWSTARTVVDRGSAASPCSAQRARTASRWRELRQRRNGDSELKFRCSSRWSWLSRSRPGATTSAPTSQSPKPPSTRCSLSRALFKGALLPGFGGAGPGVPSRTRAHEAENAEDAGTDPRRSFT